MINDKAIAKAERIRLSENAHRRSPRLRRLSYSLHFISIFAAGLLTAALLPKSDSFFERLAVDVLFAVASSMALWLTVGRWRLKVEIQRLKMEAPSGAQANAPER